MEGDTWLEELPRSRPVSVTIPITHCSELQRKHPARESVSWNYVRLTLYLNVFTQEIHSGKKCFPALPLATLSKSSESSREQGLGPAFPHLWAQDREVGRIQTKASRQNMVIGAMGEQGGPGGQNVMPL